jgi:hypothetical protein
VKKVIGIIIGSVCTVFVLSLLIAPQPKIHHQDSSAFGLALDLAVGRLEGARDVLATGTATPAGAQVSNPTFDGAYTCETFEVAGGAITCDAGDPACPGAGLPHTADPLGHTCVSGAYTCEVMTCDTYDPQALTCDAFNPQCGPVPPPPHTFEPPPYNHTCEGHTCDGAFTCDFTVDPRAFTCDAASPNCVELTFQHTLLTCDPLNINCRTNNPKGFCTAANYPTCDGISLTCDNSPGCTTATERSTWGQVKDKYKDK